MPPEDIAAKADRLRALHRAARPLVLPNAWDAASARAIERAGFDAVATSSGAITAALGYRDDDSMPVAEAAAAIARVASAVSVPVTADVEAGYGLGPDDLVAMLVGAGAVGCNLEDTDHHGDGDLVPADEQAARIGAVRDAARRAGVEVVLNARVDVFRGRDASEDAMEEGLRRARLYHEAGADCVYPITLADDAAIGAFVAGSSGPVNILRRAPAPSIARLAALGVARVSFGGELYRLAHRALTDALAEIRADTPAG